jgi:hypothetical protein
MKLAAAVIASTLAVTGCAFTPLSFGTSQSSRSQLSMVLEKPKVKKLAKIESLKIESKGLVHPLKEVCSVEAKRSELLLQRNADACCEVN